MAGGKNFRILAVSLGKWLKWPNFQKISLASLAKGLNSWLYEPFKGVVFLVRLLISRYTSRDLSGDLSSKRSPQEARRDACDTYEKESACGSACFIFVRRTGVTAPLSCFELFWTDCTIAWKKNLVRFLGWRGWGEEISPKWKTHIKPWLCMCCVYCVVYVLCMCCACVVYVLCMCRV